MAFQAANTPAVRVFAFLQPENPSDCKYSVRERERENHILLLFFSIHIYIYI